MENERGNLDEKSRHMSGEGRGYKFSKELGRKNVPRESY
jgi:hypothetical protein